MNTPASTSRASRCAARFLLTCLGLLLATPLGAATLYWDADGAGAAGGGSGAWLGANLWATDAAGTAHQTWSNATFDDAVFQGTPGTVTVGGAVSARSLTFLTGTYSVTGASTLTLSGGGGTGTINTAANNVTISTPIAGTLGLTKQGSGTLTLSGNNTYSGTTTVAQGTLRINGTHPSGNPIALSSGTTLAGDATITAAVTAAADSHIDRVGSFVSLMSITGGFTWNGSTDGSATIRLELDIGGVGDRIAISGGNLVKGSGTTFKFDFAGTGAAGTYTLITVSGGTYNFTAADLSYSNLPTGLSGTFVLSDPTKIQFVIATDTAPTISISDPSATSTATAPVTYTVTYADANFVSSSLAVADVTLNATGTATGTVEVDSGTGVTRTVTITGIGGTGTLGISIATDTAVDASGNKAPAAGPSATFSVDNSLPIITSAAIASGNYLQPFAYRITSDKTATYNATGLPAGLSLDPVTGIISGTPTTTGQFTIVLTATDAASNVGQLSVALTIIKKAVTISGLTVQNKTYDGTTTATLNTSNVVLAGVFASDVADVRLNVAGAVANFADPSVGTGKIVVVSGLSLSGAAADKYILTQPTVIGNIIGQAAQVTLADLNRVYDGLPKAVTATTVPGGLTVAITYNGISTAPTNAGSYVVTANASGGTFSGTATGTLVIAKAPQVIAFSALPDRLVSDGPVTLTASATSGLAVTFSVTGPVVHSGNTLTNTGAQGVVTVTARQSGNGNYDAAPDVVRTFNISTRPSPGLYFGTFAGDRSDAAFALLLRPDYSGLFAGVLPNLGIGVIRNISVDEGGSFTSSFVPVGSAITVTLRGRITGAGVSGSLDPFTVTFSGTSAGAVTAQAADGAPPIAAALRPDAPLDGSTLAAGAPVSGLYQVAAVGTSGSTTITVFAGADGRAFVFASDGTRASGGAATVSNAGVLSVTLSDQTRVALTFLSNGTVDGTLTPTSGVATRILGGTESLTATQRMINMSARGRTNAAAATLISGFVVRGDTPKRLVIRVAGPILSNFDVPNVLANPTLTIFNAAGTAIATNDDWSTQSPANPDIGTQMVAAGGFPFGANSRDSAIVVRLAPGNYTVHAGGGDGVVLTEVYELLDIGETPAAKKIVNFSARGQVSVANEPLTAGFAISGSTPKKLLIRGIGPGIASAVPGAVSNPRVRVYRGQIVLKENDDWFRDADAAQISAAAASVGAFPLGSQSLDAALLVVLEPGVYTAIVDNVSGSAGIGLVEVYEVP
jgi:autotransporter-associated beta strand protein